MESTGREVRAGAWNSQGIPGFSIDETLGWGDRDIVSGGRQMSGLGILKSVKTRQLLNLVLAALLVLTTLVIIPSVANAGEEAPPEEPVVTETTTTTVAEDPVVTETTTTTTAAEEPVVEETTTTIVEEPAVEEPVVTETTTTTTAAEEPVVEEPTTTTIAEEPLVTETTTTLAEEPVVEEPTTTTVAEEPVADVLVDNAVEEEHEEEEAPALKITFVKRVCPTFGEIRSNQNKNWDLQEHAEDLGAKIGTLNVTAAVEDAAHPGCSPIAGWGFSMGTEIDASSGPLSQVADPFPVGIVTQASTPVLDNNGDPTGANVAGAVTIEVTQEQLDAAALSHNGALSVSEGSTSGGGALVPAGFEFGILRCGFDNRHGDNVEWIFFSKNGVEFANHITCYAYNVATAQPDFEITKDAVDIDGVPYADGDIAKVGETINYEVTVTNTGNVDFTDLVIADPGLDAPGLTCAWAGDAGDLASGESVTCTGSHVTTVDDGTAGDYYNVSTAETVEWEIQKDDDELVPVDFNYQVTFVKRVCNSYDGILKNFNNSDHLVESVVPLSGVVTWHTVDVALEQASVDCAPQTGWDFSIGTGFSAPAGDADPGTLSQVTGNFGTVIQTQASTPLLDKFGLPTGIDVAGAVTIDLSNDQIAAAADQSLWVSEGLNGPDGGVLPDGFGFGVMRCGSDNRNGDNVEFLSYPSLRPGNGGEEAADFGLLGEHVQVRLPQTHTVCIAYNVALNPQIEVTKTVDKPIIIAKDSAEFTIEIANTGNIVLNDLTLDDVMTYGDTGAEDLTTCEIPDDTTLDPGAITHATCTVDLDSTTHGESVLNTVTATATPVLGDDVSDSDDATVTIIPPSPAFLNAACISEPIEAFGFSLDQPLLEWSTSDLGPTFDAATDTLELRMWTKDQDPTTDAPAIVYEVPWDSDLLGQEPFASAAGAPTTDRIFVEGGQGYLYWPGYDNSGWTGPENGLAGIVYPGDEWRPTAYQFAFNPETAVIVVEYPPATVDCVPGGAIHIDKLAGPLGTAASSSDFVDAYNRVVDETEVTWQVTVKNLTDYTLFDIVFTDDIAPSCLTAFEAAVQTNDTGNFMTPQEELVITCDSTVGDEAMTNTATVGGTDLWGSAIIPVSDDASTYPPITTRGGEEPPPPEEEAVLGSIGDTVWTDENSNGVQDNGESGLANAVVQITMPDTSTLNVTTASNGEYTFGNLAPGEYTVKLIVSSISVGADEDLMVTTATSFTIQLAEGEVHLDADFGVVTTLPKTGIDTDTILIIAISLMLLGGTAVLVTRRRNQGEEGSVAA